jgi:phosphoribosylformylglycinamidine synthase
MRTCVIVFPGSNCDMDNARSWKAVTGLSADLVWHKESSLPNYDIVIVPGGFSFGDYLRTGAVARFSPVMGEVARLAGRGSLVLGICNGFQILTEAKLLPGALARNHGLKYLCKDVAIRVERASTPFTSDYDKGRVLTIPISHGEGSYTISPSEHKKLLDDDLVVFRYCSPSGEIRPCDAPNGSLDNIAGVISKAGNVLGLMPHPERAAEEDLGGLDGKGLFTSMLKAMGGRVR